MKKYLMHTLLALFLLTAVGCEEDGTLRDFGGGLSEDEVIAGLKEALSVGSDSSVSVLNRVDGYWQDAAVRILLPQQVQNVRQAAGTIGLDNAFGVLLDEYQVLMNRAAENAAEKALPILKDAVTGISIQDGWNILRGHETAATEYLNTATYTGLVGAYVPDVTAAMEQVGAQQAWSSIVSTYNPVINTYNSTVAVITGNTFQTLPPDLSQYTTEKALDGLFLKVGDEEKRIRQDPIARVTDLLKRVFSQQ